MCCGCIQSIPVAYQAHVAAPTSCGLSVQPKNKSKYASTSYNAKSFRVRNGMVMRSTQQVARVTIGQIDTRQMAVSIVLMTSSNDHFSSPRVFNIVMVVDHFSSMKHFAARYIGVCISITNGIDSFEIYLCQFFLSAPNHPV